MGCNVQWKSNHLLIEYVGDITIKDIKIANKQVHGDKRTYKTVGAISDFTNCKICDVNQKDFIYIKAVDIGSANTIKEYKMAFVANDKNIKHLLKDYIDFCVNSGSPWEFKIFDSREQIQEWFESS